MTTRSDESSPEQRSVQELLKLDSYQGMSDAEITSLMEYQTRITAIETRDETLQAQHAELQRSLQDAADAANEKAQAAFDAAVTSTVAFGTVSA